MLQPVLMLNTGGLHDIRREIAFFRELVEQLHGRLYCFRARFVFLGPINFALLAACMLKSKGADDPWQHQALTHQCYEDDREGEEKDQVAVGERLAVAVVNGIASAAASETIPRTPVNDSTNGLCQGGDGSLRLIERK